jgi:charged multivesicular body protein 1
MLLQAIQKGNMEGAKIHAENSIRQKNQALNYRRMSARIDAVAARVQTAVTTKQVVQTLLIFMKKKLNIYMCFILQFLCLKN